ncbi:MAG: hypothetical protein ACKO2Z_22485, partial [Sphaerospermopsis kisseleviana]
MKKIKNIISIAIVSFITLTVFQSAYTKSSKIDVLSYTVDSKKQNIQLFWKDDKGTILKSFN